MKKTPFQQIQEQCKSIMPSSAVQLLPKKWEKIGEVLLLKIPHELRQYQTSIGKIYALVLSCKSVLNEKGAIDGLFRVPDVELIWGDPNTCTVHYENRIRFRLDPAKLMFSSGNIDERKRMATIANKEETVVDMFAGIGYFSIPLAVYSRPKKVFACEINPDAYMFLKQNIVLNDVTDIVEPILGDNQKTAPRNVADRVLMGYFGETGSYFQTALSCLKEDGGMVHYHDLFPDRKVPEEVMKNVLKMADHAGRRVTLKKVRKVKSFAPGISHYVFDLYIES